MSARTSGGFTLVELVVAISISSLVLVFVGMFLTAPLAAFDSQSRRNNMVGSAAMVWPRMEQDLRGALPNSVRAMRNGNFVVIEMIAVAGKSRSTSAPGGSFGVAGTATALFSGLPLNSGPATELFVSVNNPGQQVYAQFNGAPPTINWSHSGNGLGTVAVTPAFIPSNGASAGNRVYLVRDRAAITYLCDETQGTIRRYRNYALAAAQGARAAPAAFGGAANELVARGVTRCEFSWATNATQAQVTSARFTFAQNNETMTLLHTVRGENAP